MDLPFLTRLAGVDLRTRESIDCEQCFGHDPYQKRMLVLLGTFMTHCQTLVVSLVTGDVDHWWKPPDGFNISVAEWKDIAIPMETDGRFSRCHVYERCMPPAEHDALANRQDVGAVTPAVGSWCNRCFPDQVQDINSTRDAPCEARDYDVHTAESSAVSTWNVVCDQRLMRVVLVSMPSSGNVVALVLVRAFADCIGRRTLLLGSAIAMLTCEICTFVATEYAYYAMACFLMGRSVAVNGVLTYIVPFESTTHAQRPQQVLLLAVIGATLCEVWTFVLETVVVDWRVKQVIFLAPAARLFPVLCFARKTPRWLVARSRLDPAEVVMTRTAKINNFPLPAMACLMQKLKEHLKNHAGCESYEEFWISVFTVVITLLAYVHYRITGVTLVPVISVCFVLVGCMQCGPSITDAAALGKLTKALLAICKGVSSVVLLHCWTYVMDLFSPSALRAGVSCWSFACFRFAGTCATLILVLRTAGYEDVVFAITALVLFVPLLTILDLPKTTVAEEAKVVARDPTNSNRMSVDHMK
ncbi:hypothetical protein MTO96_045245 [Rhipicephalus appendiculatus]